jgi:transposase
VKERIEWREKQANMELSNTYWLDESGINCGMTRLYGRAFPGERIIDYVPDVRFERTSVIAALGLDGIVAPMVYKGTLTGALFRAYVEQFLAPVMKKGDTLILDNLSVHRVSGALDSLVEKGVTVIFQPRYSPDLNPIENAWSKIKAYLRKVKARTHEDLFKAIGEAIDSIERNDIAGWIKHCGYGLR